MTSDILVDFNPPDYTTQTKRLFHREHREEKHGEGTPTSAFAGEPTCY